MCYYYSMNKEQLQSLYLENDLSQREVAKNLGVSQSTIRYYLGKYDIKKSRYYNYSASDPKSVKKCPKCHLVQPISSFYVRKNPKDPSKRIAGSWCKVCLNQATLARQRKVKQDCIDYKGGKCSNCDFNAYNGALEFHHLDPTKKDFGLSRFNNKNLNAAGKRELDKCSILCANCHRMAHAGLINPKP